MARFRSVLALGIGAWLLLALVVALISLAVGDHDTTFTPSPAKEVFAWLHTMPSTYRFVAAAVIGCVGGAMAVATARRYKLLGG